MASGRSIRFKISTLLVLPLVSLVGLWGFAASTTSGEAMGLLKVDTIWSGVINHADFLVYTIEQERLAAAEVISGGVADPAQLAATRGKVDEVKKRLSDGGLSETTQAALTPEMRGRLKDVFTAVDRLPEIRKKVDSRQLTPGTLITEYSAVSDAVHHLYPSLTLGTDVELAQQAQGLIAASEVRELLSREHSLIIAANGKPSMGDMHMLAKLDGTRTYMFPKAMANLDAELRTPFEQVTESPRWAAMERALDGYVAGRMLDPAVWRGMADPELKAYTQVIWDNGDRLLARMTPAGIAILVRAGVAGVLGLIAVALSIFISIRVGRRVSRELAALRRNALDLAEIRLPGVVTKLRQGKNVDIPAEVPPIKMCDGATSEIDDLAKAFDSVQYTAVDAAVEQAKLRQGVSEALRNLARRSQSLLQRQLKLLDEMQRETEDPEALSRLFKIDHLTTRMRRHAEGLVLLSGGSAGRRWRGVIPVEDVLSGAAAQVEEYTRVRVYPMPECGVSGAAVADLMHLFAELIENAAAFSSPGNEVSVRGELVGRGFAVEVEDRGLGMTPEARQAVNERLESPPEFEASQTERLGFSVVGMLAARHGITVTLKPSPYGGTTAIVLVPTALIQALPTPVRMPELESVSVSVVRTPQDTRTSHDTRTPHDTTAPGQLPRRQRTAKHGPERSQESALPRRVRQANLPEQLKQSPPPEQTEALSSESRSPEEARALLSSLQSGWQRGRQDSDQDGGSQS
ncbi:nitrate- and nitrite sensing domain-containing protein [Nonomuraea sp. NPDC048901]|uniref:sensor histidine kinase n=1 Tax=unclassified Nonomuraea TaxID=2593643 RepID=UPI0034087C0B